MNSLPSLTLIPAGAGSGKTHTIKEQLADWVESGLVAPDRIAAVTFTENAASELRDRIRATLIDRKRLEEALRLDRSFISTIHGLGKRLLVEYAFEAGNCPAPRLLEEDEEQMLLRRAVAGIDRIEPISRRLYRFGYRYDFASATADVEQFRQRILTAIHILRIIGGSADRVSRLHHCLKRINDTYGPVDDPGALTTALRRSVKSLLARYPDCMRDCVNSDSAKSSVEDDHRHLQRAALSGDLEEDWTLWKRLQGLKVFRNDDQLPAEYQEMAREVMAHAARLCRHPGPLDDALLHAEVLLESAWDALEVYAGRKREKGIIDYIDMIDGARLLLMQPAVLQHLAGRFDCLVIDEFQDTNPLQFSLLWKLHKAGVPALVVGDLKQSIMGFQSADPRLMASLLEQHPDQCSPLDGNWRSRAELMDVVNALSARLFGKEYTRLAPKAPFKSKLHPLEIICFQGKSIFNRARTQHVAARVKALLSDKKVKVFDRHTGRYRRIRGEDIAILGLTHPRLHGYADALRELGIRARLAMDGWFESREIQLAFHGLSYVADPGDRHAALYLAVTELGEDDLNGAVQTLLNGDELSFPLLQWLRELSDRQGDLAVDELVATALDTMRLFDLAATWPEADQVRANLLRLIDEARAFVTADREALAGGGYYGSGLKTFLSWLGTRLGGREGDRQPDAQAHEEEAVQLLTWHAAKGKEWPVVIVTTLDRKLGGKLPSLDIEYTDFSDLGRILDNARLEFSPIFAASETCDRFREVLDEKARKEGLNLLYVALTRARETLILEWQSNLEDSAKTTYWHLLRESAGLRLEADTLLIGAEAFSCRVTAAGREPPSDFESVPAVAPEKLPRIGRRALVFGPSPKVAAPIFVTPSKLPGQLEGQLPGQLKTDTYGLPPGLDLPPGADRGLLIHRAIELLGQGVGPDRVRKALGLELSDPDWEKVQNLARAFAKHLQQKFKPVNLHWEVPVASLNEQGSFVGGTIDLLVEADEGCWIVDHKSEEPIDLEETFKHYFPQLNAYARALSAGLKMKVLGVAIHWACLGSISSVIKGAGHSKEPYES